MKALQFFPVVSSAALGALLMAGSGCGKHPETSPTPSLPVATVSYLKVENKKHQANEEVVGTVRARLRASIEAKVTGRIQKMNVRAGQSVKEGEVLAELEVREIQARHEQALAVREQAKTELNRYEQLVKTSAATRQELDRAEMQFRVAEASVKETETMLGYAKITAPFDGLITRKLADQGDLAAPGRSLLELDNPRTLWFEAEVPEALIDRVQSATKMQVMLSSQSQPVEGVVSEIEPVADPNSRTVKVKLDLPADAGLRVGVFGRVAIPVAEVSAVRVPAKAVVVRGQMEMVFAMVGGKAQMRLVKTGKVLGEEVELLSGVSAGEIIAVDGAAQLLDGQPVTEAK